MSQETGLTGVGAYIPSLRMSRKAIAAAHSWALPALRGLGKGTRAFCSWDEDAITMGVEATRACLAGQAGARDAAGLSFASTTAPFADYSNAVCLAGAANLSSDIQAQDVSGTLRAGTSALIAALEQTNGAPRLIAAADNRRTKPGSAQEMHYGAGAACLAVGAENIIANYLGSYSVAAQFADHYRAADKDYDYYWEERWARDEGFLKLIPGAVNALLKKTGTAPGDIAYLCVPGAVARLGASVARKTDIPADAVVDNFAATIGDTGAPQPFLMLIEALRVAKPGDKILVIGFGSGCDALLFEATDAIRDVEIPAFTEGGKIVEHYNQLLSFSGELSLDWGMRGEVDNKLAVSELYRSQDQISGFNGGQCPDCGAIQFPVLSTCVACGSTAAMTPAPLADAPAQVATYTADYLQFYPAPPMYWGLVQFDNGARLLMEMVDVDKDKIAVGAPLKMVYRIKQKDERRGLDRYFWKATPARGA